MGGVLGGVVTVAGEPPPHPAMIARLKVNVSFVWPIVAFSGVSVHWLEEDAIVA